MKSKHPDAKPFHCHLCDTYFARKFILEDHIIAVHQGVKPFQCDQCEYSTAKKGNLKQHVKTVHEKNLPFKCTEPDCEKAYATPSCLKKHIESVQGREDNQRRVLNWPLFKLFGDLLVRENLPQLDFCTQFEICP